MIIPLFFVYSIENRIMAGLSAIEEKLISVREKQVLLDRDVAFFYGVETKRVNEAVKNNPEKFPEGYIINLTKEEWQNQLIENFDQFKNLKHSYALPKAFTEKDYISWRPY